MIKFSGNNVLIHYISPVITIPSKSGGQDFQKRELIIDDSWDKDGRHFANFVLIEFSGDRMGMLDSFFPGQRVNIEGMLTGREYNNKIYNTVKGTNISPAQSQQQYAPSPAPMPGYPQPQQQYAPQYPQQSAPGYPQPSAPSYPQQSAPQPQFPSSPAPAQQPYTAPSGAPGVNDLPFSTR